MVSISPFRAVFFLVVALWFFPRGETLAKGPSEAKGVAMGVQKCPDWKGRVEALRVRWIYSWTADGPEGMPAGVEFVPMIWGDRGNPEATCERLAALQKAGSHKHLLGFNEPDGKDQADMTVETALKIWPFLEKTKLRLGSPATVHGDNAWMTEFMKGAEARALRVDFICVHWYGGPSVPSLLRYLERVHDLYNRPIWITEFAVADWQAKSRGQNRHSPESVEAFLKGALKELKRLKYVERFAWFSADPDSGPLGLSALFDAKGELTAVGKLYAGF
jgi:hypothetical protein